MHKPQLMQLLPVVAVLLGLQSMQPALADVTFGGSSRAVAMGGAGLASGDAPGATTLNPAFLASTGIRVGIEMPTVDARMEGASWVDALSLLGDPAVNLSEAWDLIKEFGTGTTRLDASAQGGVLLPKMDVRVNAALRTEIEPNADFRTWLLGGASPAALLGAGNPQADLRAAGLLTLPSLGLGVYVPGMESGKLAVGVRVKPTRAYYSHYIVDASSYNANTGAVTPQPAAEMGGEEVLKATSLSADLGLTFQPAGIPGMTLAMVVNNMLEPKELDFNVGTPAMFSRQLAPRTVSAGMAWETKMTTVAVDLVDLTKAFNDDPELRIGGELRLPLGLALRGGYNSTYGSTVGLGLLGFGIAISEKAPLMLSQSVAF
jgi:hypothetical protein